VKYFIVWSLVVTALHMSVCGKNDVALIVFSKNRPLQLYALLESIHDHVRGLARIIVLYHVENNAYEAGYRVVKKEYPCVTFIAQSRTNPRGDFYRLLLDSIKSAQASYIMFAVDDMVIIRPVDLNVCIRALQRVPHAYGFYLWIGRDITTCYMGYDMIISPPLLQEEGEGVYSWRIDSNRGEWSWYNCTDMALYPKSQLLAQVQAIANKDVCSPNGFEKAWNKIILPQGARGLCFNYSRTINIPLNLVQKDAPRNRCWHHQSAEKLLKLFNKGYRISVDELYDLPHTSAHIEIELPLEKRRS